MNDFLKAVFLLANNPYCLDFFSYVVNTALVLLLQLRHVQIKIQLASIIVTLDNWNGFQPKLYACNGSEDFRI